MTNDLTDRQHLVLRYLVDEYVASGKAVGSKTLVETYPLNVSSATVRNEMAILEQRGYIHHPHRSAGSVPTDRGYRVYVERYARRAHLSSGEQLMIRHQFKQVETQIEAWLQLSAAVLADFAGHLAMVTSPRPRTVRLRHFELLSLQPRIALLIMVTQDSAVTQSVIHVDGEISQATLTETSARLNALLENQTATEMQRVIPELSGFEAVVAEQIVTTLKAGDSGARTEIMHEGLEHMVRQPEFLESERMHRIVTLLRGGALLTMLLPQIDESGRDVQVFIGEEIQADPLRPYGIVIGSYGLDADASGLIGIVGPTRMYYERSISTVRYMADLMSDMMQELYYRD
ncbi:MAG: heat-inducible transcriptional repressor HrcA [Thermomicrobiales bacterium]